MSGPVEVGDCHASRRRGNDGESRVPPTPALSVAHSVNIPSAVGPLKGKARVLRAFSWAGGSHSNPAAVYQSIHPFIKPLQYV